MEMEKETTINALGINFDQDTPFMDGQIIEKGKYCIIFDRQQLPSQRRENPEHLEHCTEEFL